MDDGGERREQLALPAPGDSGGSTPTTRVELPTDGTTTTVSFDSLGPMVVNEDGTLSRITNWATLTEGERQTTMRVLVKRNQQRIKNLESQQPPQGE